MGVVFRVPGMDAECLDHQRPVLPPGTLAPLHPIGFVVITKPQVYGVPVSATLRAAARSPAGLTFSAFGLEEGQLNVTRIAPLPSEGGKVIDMIFVRPVNPGLAASVRY